MTKQLVLLVLLLLGKAFSKEKDLEEEDTAQKADQLLNDIVNYGLEQSDELSNVHERILYEEGIHLHKSNPAHFVAIFNRQKARGRELSKFAYAALEASSLLARQ